MNGKNEKKCVWLQENNKIVVLTVLAECYYSAKKVENNETCCVLMVYFSVVKDSVTSVSFSLESVRLAVG